MKRAPILFQKHQRNDTRLDQQDLIEEKGAALSARQDPDRPRRALQKSQQVVFERACNGAISQIIADTQARENRLGTPQPLHRDALFGCEPALAFEKHVELDRPLKQTSDAEYAHNVGGGENRCDAADDIPTFRPHFLPRTLGDA